MAAGTVERGQTARAGESSAKRESRFTFNGRLLAPALIVLALLSIFPFIYIVMMSLSRVGLIGGIELHWAGLDNWTRLFSDETVGAAWIRSIVYFVLTVGLEMTLGIGFALLVHSMVWGKNLVISLLLMPMFMAPAIVGLLGRFLTDSTYGLYAWVLRETHIYTGDILGSTTSAFLAVTLMDVWEWTPLIALIVLAGLSSLPKPVIEASRVDGATYWQRLRHIVFPMISLPLLRPRLLAAIGLSMLAVSILLANLFMRVLKKRELAR